MIVRLIVRTYGKSILKWAGKKAMQKVQKKFEQQYAAQGNQEGSVTSPSGSRRSSVHPPASTKNNKKVGEYVDYEEID